MKTIDLAVIIPTLNEEHFIGNLLDSIAQQTYLPKEVIVIDACSKDETKREVLLRKNVFPSLIFETIPKKTIARQRNYGVSKTTASHILFLDADMQLGEKDSMQKLWRHIKKSNPDVATCYIMPISSYKKDKVMYGTGNVIITMIRHIKPLATTMNLYIRRDVFEALGGFNEKIRVAEDFDLVSRAAKADYHFNVFMRPVMYTSVRRLEYEGRIRYIAKLFKAMVGVSIYGFERTKIPYKFGHFSSKSISQKDASIRQLQNQGIKQ